MSSINNNGSNYQNTDNAAALTPDELLQQNQTLQQRKNAEKVLLANQKGKETNIIQLVGMTPTDAANAINGTPSPKSNKYSAAGAVSSLPAPSAPKTTVTSKTQALYSSMHSDINEAIGTVAKGKQALDWSTLSPTLHVTKNQAEFDKAVDTHTAAATNTVTSAISQFKNMSSDDMTMAFLMLRSQGQSDGLNINNQMGDMQSAIRKADLNEQIKSDKEAQKKLDKAAAKMAAMKKAGPIVEAIIAVLTAIITIATAGTGIGLALTLAAMLIGFVAGGAAGGAKKGDGFDMDSAVTGLSVGSLIIPMGAVLNAMVKAITSALEKVGMKTASDATKVASEKAVQKVSAKVADTAAAKAGQEIMDTIKSGQAYVKQNASKLLGKAEADAKAAAEKVGRTEAARGAQEGDAAVSRVATRAKETESHIINLLPQELRSAFTAAQKVVNNLGKMGDYFKDMPAQKITSIIENSLYVGQVVTGEVQAAGNFATAQENIKAQKLLLQGKFWGEGATIAQNSWKNTQDFLSTMQDQHNSGITQIQQILASHNQINSKAISNISA